MKQKKNNFIFFLIFLFSFFFPQISNASSSSTVLIEEITNRASEVLSSDLANKEKILKLREIGKNAVDIDGVGLYTLGKYRKGLTESQKTEYQKIFKEYFLKSFSGRLVNYKDAKIVVISEDIKNEKYTIVYSKLLGNEDRPEVKINWRVYTKNPDKPLIRDLVIEGLSLARTQKEEFNSIIQNNNGDINALFSSLKEFNQN